jgi:ABC-type branched-subunit amino acid transport system ATPase component
MTLTVKNIRSGYGDRSIIDEISFTVPSGNIMALFGHNGAGKSTTLRAILGLLPLSQGSIELDGRRIDHMTVSDRTEAGLRLLPEGRGVFPDLTVEENLKVVAAANRRKGANGSAGTTAEKVYQLFPVLAEKRNLQAANLSGGQQQMLAFGLAILGSPRCVLLEEPSVGLQPDLVEELFGHFRVICREHDMSAILIEHRITSALKIVDEVMILNNGRVAYHDSTEATKGHDLWQYF